MTTEVSIRDLDLGTKVYVSNTHELGFEGWPEQRKLFEDVCVVVVNDVTGAVMVTPLEYWDGYTSQPWGDFARHYGGDVVLANPLPVENQLTLFDKDEVDETYDGTVPASEAQDVDDTDVFIGGHWVSDDGVKEAFVGTVEYVDDVFSSFTTTDDVEVEVKEITEVVGREEYDKWADFTFEFLLKAAENFAGIESAFHRLDATVKELSQRLETLERATKPWWKFW